MTRPETRVRDLVLVCSDQRVAWRGNHAPADPAGVIDRVGGAVSEYSALSAVSRVGAAAAAG